MGLDSRSQGMECGATALHKPSKPPSNISDIVSKFAKACKLRSIGVLTSENNGSNHLHYPRNGNNDTPSLGEESSSDATEEAECDGEKVHPQPIEIESKENESGSLEILKLFDTLSAMKLAYVRLQEAHIPYDPDKIRAADEIVVSQLEALCRMRRAYKEKRLKEENSVSQFSALLLAQIQVQERLLEKLKSQARVKENQVVKLRRELQELEVKNRKLAEDFRLREKEDLKVLQSLTFEDVVKAVAKGIHDFAKPLIALMKVSGWDLDRAANSVKDSVVYSKRSHKKYAFEAYISRRMFHGFAVAPQLSSVGNVMKFEDPIDALIADPQSSFARFCRTKYLLVVHEKMEMSFFGNLDHRTFITNGLHPQTPFYRAFVKMAKSVWILQGMTASIEPKAEIFRVKQGCEFSEVYMEFVEEEEKVVFGEGTERYRVEFMVMPGFRVGNTLIKSRVYLSGIPD